MNRKHTKRALFSSLLALLLCAAMLVGSTFAWFTDSASTGVNKIQAGNLDIDIVDATTGESLEGKKLGFVKEDGSAITGEILWEPGCRYLLQPAKLVNKGTLWVKYTVAISGYTAPTDGSADLTKVIDVYEGTKRIGTLSEVLSGNVLVMESTLAPMGQEGNSAAFNTLKLVMQESAGNDYMNKSIDGISITVYATQLNHENDSFGPDYDKDATGSYISKPEQLKSALENGGNFIMAFDTEFTEEVEITNDTVLNLQGNALTVSDTADIKVADGAELTIVNGTVVSEASGEKKAIEVTNTKAGTTTVLNLENVTIDLDSPDYENELANNIYASAEAGDVVVNIGEGTEITSAAEHHALVYVGKNATVNMTDGVLDLTNVDPDGAWTCVWGVYLDDATAVFNMSGGVIDVKGSHSASGIYEYGSNPTVNISGGTINVATDADCTGFAIGVELYSGNFSFTGGTINVMAEEAKNDAEALYVGKNVNITGLSKDAVVNLRHDISEKNVLCTTSKKTAFEEGITVKIIHAPVTDPDDLQDALEKKDSVTVDVGNDTVIKEDTVEVPEGKELTIESGKIDTTENYGIALSVGKDSTLTLNDGSYTAFEMAQVINAQAEGAEVILNGGAYDGNYLAFVGADAEVTVNGGTFATPEYPGTVIVATDDDNNTSVITITGGTFYSEAICDNFVKISITGGTFYVDGISNYPNLITNEWIEITGGTFSVDPSAYVPAGYAAAKNGEMWVVSKA